jgi:hypothetical protein
VSRKVLWNFYWDCGRQGSIDGRFLATEEEVKAAIGQELYFGEVLGKHSEICGTLEEKDVTLVTDNPEFLFQANDLGIDLETGFNPLSYLPEEV